MKHSQSKIKQKFIKCLICNTNRKPITIIIKGKIKRCFECNCGIFNKSRQKIDI